MSQQKFVNREQELAFFEEKLASRKPELVVLYGRRRVGKSELMVHFLKGRGVYFLCSTEGDRENIRALQEKLADFFGEESLKGPLFDDWRKFFSSIFSHVRVAEFLKKNKLALCLDEFPYLIKANSSIPSIFQQVWEETMKDHNVLLILTGSFISVMESSVIGHQSPLYGRSTGIWQLSPLAFPHLKKFLPTYSTEDLIKTWCITGGVPYYILRFDPHISLSQNIKRCLLKKGEPLYKEVDVILNEEFREARNYRLILKAISTGQRVLNEIVNATGLDKSMVSKYLEVLKSTGIVRDLIPVTKGSTFKRRIYLISDQYFHFWFRFISTSMIDLEANLIEEVFTRIQKELNNYFGIQFEAFIEELAKEKSIADIHFEKIGKWWHKEEEIDLVALNEQTDEITFIECKFQDNADAGRILKRLREKSRLVDWRKEERKEHFMLFAKSFRKKEKGCFDLADIEKVLW